MFLRTRSFRPPILNFVLYLIAIAAVPICLSSRLIYLPIALIAMVLIHHGTHEAIHGTLVPRKGRHQLANLVFGGIGLATIGHNFIFLQWSHMVHHRYGREHRIYTLDEGVARHGSGGLVWYYLSLLGIACLYHEIIGYRYLLGGSKFQMTVDKFPKKYYLNNRYRALQIFTGIYTVSLIWFAGWHFLLFRCLFMVYWGMFQNTAHYGLEVATGPESRLAARTYRVSLWYEILIFRAGTYHLEHHILPTVPGPHLNSVFVREEVRRMLGFSPPAKFGLLTYWMDCLRQVRGPRPESVQPLSWKPPAQFDSSLVDSSISAGSAD